jgi:8-oxo-dGTP diphosphatase
VAEELVRAAGGVVWRTGTGQIELLLVHRPKYDDWSFPKGKCEDDEPDEDCALREIEEETGLSDSDLFPCPDAKILDVDVHRIPARGTEPAHLHLDLRYGFVARVGAAPRVSEESRELRWFSTGAMPEGCDRSLLRAVVKLCNAAANA